MLVTALAGAIVGIPSFRLEGAYLGARDARACRSLFASSFPAPNGSVPRSVTRAFLHPISAASRSATIAPTTTSLCRSRCWGCISPSASCARTSAGLSRRCARIRLLRRRNGVNVRKYKLIAFVLSALYAGCAGSLQAHMAPGFLHPNSYTITEMITLLLMVVFGGIGHIWGGVIGAIIVTIIDDLTRDYYQYRMAMFGSVIVLTVMFMPRGIGRPHRRLPGTSPLHGDPQAQGRTHGRS